MRSAAVPAHSEGLLDRPLDELQVVRLGPDDFLQEPVAPTADGVPGGRWVDRSRLARRVRAGSRFPSGR